MPSAGLKESFRRRVSPTVAHTKPSESVRRARMLLSGPLMNESPSFTHRPSVVPIQMRFSLSMARALTRGAGSSAFQQTNYAPSKRFSPLRVPAHRNPSVSWAMA